MAVIRVRRSTTLTVPPRVGGGMVLSNGQTSVTLPLLPDQVDFGGLSDAWSEQPRPGRDPLLVRDGAALKTMRFDAELALPNRGSVDDTIQRLRRLSSAGKPVSVTLGGRDRGLYRITELACPELAWDSLGRPIEARAIAALTEASDVPKRKGPVSKDNKKRKGGGRR